MTVIWVEVTPQGILIGGDKHRTHFRITGAIAGYSVVTKVFKTPNRKVIVGAAGLGRFGGKDKSKWLKEKIVPLQDEPIETIAQSVHSDIVATYDAEFRNGDPQCFIVDIAGYRKDGEMWVPAVYYISNCWSIVNGNLTDVRHDFGQYPEIITIERCQGLDPATIVQRIGERANAGNPVWIYHTPLVGQFRAEAEQRLNQWLSKHGTPRTLSMWERQVKQTIVAWSAYVKTQLNNETVGGGADVVSVAPPKLGWFELVERIFRSMLFR